MAQILSDIAFTKRRIQSGTIIKILLTITCFFIILYQPNCEFEITFLDVGQGDGIYICDGENGDFFIDGGSTDEKNLGKRRILPFLKSNGIKKIDYWFVTHADTDHISGVLEVLESGYKVKNLVLPKAIPKDENYEKLVNLAKANETDIVYMEAGNYIKTKSIKLECLYPENIEINDRNDSSLVLELEKDSFRALFTGDISVDVEKQLLEKGCLEDISLYKAAHHGSKTANSIEFLEKVLPEIAVISCGENNSYGHPSQEAIEHMEIVGAEIYYTMDSGQITVSFEKDGRIRIDTYR